jgi:hypothetical protein
MRIAYHFKTATWTENGMVTRARAETERVEREAAILAQQKAARDERYAARKAAKKRRRKG